MYKDNKKKSGSTQIKRRLIELKLFLINEKVPKVLFFVINLVALHNYLWEFQI
jgi:hypothetical protein